VSIDTQGRDYKWTQEIINADVDTKRKPVRVDISLDSKIGDGLVTLRIEPLGK